MDNKELSVKFVEPDGNINVICEYPNGTYANLYNYDEKNNVALASSEKGFSSYTEAYKVLLQCRPNAVPVLELYTFSVPATAERSFDKSFLAFKSDKTIDEAATYEKMKTAIAEAETVYDLIPSPSVIWQSEDKDAAPTDFELKYLMREGHVSVQITGTINVKVAANNLDSALKAASRTIRDIEERNTLYPLGNIEINGTAISKNFQLAKSECYDIKIQHLENVASFVDMLYDIPTDVGYYYNTDEPDKTMALWKSISNGYDAYSYGLSFKDMMRQLIDAKDIEKSTPMNIKVRDFFEFGKKFIQERIDSIVNDKDNSIIIDTMPDPDSNERCGLTDMHNKLLCTSACFDFTSADYIVTILQPSVNEENGKVEISAAGTNLLTGESTDFTFRLPFDMDNDSVYLVTEVNSSSTAEQYDLTAEFDHALRTFMQNDAQLNHIAKEIYLKCNEQFKNIDEDISRE